MSKQIRPYMKKAEWNFLKSYLDINHTMLEYGSGSSTVCIAPLVKNLWSIEHDPEWYSKVLDMTKNFSNVNLNLVRQNFPRSNPTKLEEFNDYVNFIKDKNVKFNRVLIDGRARQWCAETILDKLDEDHIVFVHDYNLNERPDYKRVEQFYSIIDRCHSMIALVKK
jgi:hypothetical protein